jgi:hypothetical protein
MKIALSEEREEFFAQIAFSGTSMPQYLAFQL